MQTTLATEFGGLDNVELLKGDGIPYLNGGAVGKFDRLFTSAPDVHVGMAVSHWVHEGGTPRRLAVLLWEHYQPLDCEIAIQTRKGSCCMCVSGERRRFVSVLGPQ